MSQLGLDAIRKAAKLLDEGNVPTFDRMIYVPGIGPVDIDDPRAAEYMAQAYPDEISKLDDR